MAKSLSSDLREQVEGGLSRRSAAPFWDSGFDGDHRSHRIEAQPGLKPECLVFIGETGASTK